MAEKSLLIANEKLKKAEDDIVILRRLVDHTIAIIVAAGGRVEIPATVSTNGRKDRGGTTTMA